MMYNKTDTLNTSFQEPAGVKFADVLINLIREIREKIQHQGKIF